MMSRKELNDRLEALKGNGMRLQRPFVQADLSGLRKIISAEYEITVAEIVGDQT